MIFFLEMKYMNATLVERATVDARDKRNHLASNKAITQQEKFGDAKGDNQKP